MPATSSSEKIIQEKNKEIEGLRIEVEEYKDLDRCVKAENARLKMIVKEYKEAIDELRTCGLQLAEKYEKVSTKRKKTISENKRLAKVGRTWKTEALKHLAHISMLKKKLKDSREHASGKFNIIVNTS
jgi:chromosome segregation ATPase